MACSEPANKFRKQPGCRLGIPLALFIGFGRKVGWSGATIQRMTVAYGLGKGRELVSIFIGLLRLAESVVDPFIPGRLQIWVFHSDNQPTLR